jgi:hypothetical protein
MKAKSPYFLVQIPEGLHHMDATLNTCFESSAELVNAAGLLGFSAYHKEEDFCHRTAPTFTSTNWADTRTFIKGAKPS